MVEQPLSLGPLPPAAVASPPALFGGSRPTGGEPSTRLLRGRAYTQPPLHTPPRARIRSAAAAPPNPVPVDPTTSDGWYIGVAGTPASAHRDPIVTVRAFATEEGIVPGDNGNAVGGAAADYQGDKPASSPLACRPPSPLPFSPLARAYGHPVAPSPPESRRSGGGRGSPGRAGSPGDGAAAESEWWNGGGDAEAALAVQGGGGAPTGHHVMEDTDTIGDARSATSPTPRRYWPKTEPRMTADA